MMSGVSCPDRCFGHMFGCGNCHIREHAKARVKRAKDELVDMENAAEFNDEMLLEIYTTSNHWHYRKDAEYMSRFYNFAIPWQKKVIEHLK